MLSRLNKKVIEKLAADKTLTELPVVLLEASSYECVDEVETKAAYYRKKGFLIATVYFKGGYYGNKR